MGHWLILPFFGFGLFCLVFMHAHWFILFVQVLLHYIKKGEAEDKVEADLSKNDIESRNSKQDEAVQQIDTESPVIGNNINGTLEN